MASRKNDSDSKEGKTTKNIKRIKSTKREEMPRESSEQRYQRELSKLVYSQPKNLSFTQGGKDVLESTISAGAKQLAADGASENQIKLAEESARILAREITAVGRRADFRIGKSEMTKLLQKLCPIYPFCRRPRKP